MHLLSFQEIQKSGERFNTDTGFIIRTVLIIAKYSKAGMCKESSSAHKLCQVKTEMLPNFTFSERKFISTGTVTVNPAIFLD